MKLKSRRTELCRAIELAYGSMETHFEGAVKSFPPKKITGDEAFNATAIREYAEIMYICASELEHINLESCKKKKKKH